MTETRGWLQIWHCPEGSQDGWVIGGAGFDTAHEAKARFDAVPRVPEPDFPAETFVLDRLDADHDIVEDKSITRESAITLLGPEGEWSRPLITLNDYERAGLVRAGHADDCPSLLSSAEPRDE